MIPFRALFHEWGIEIPSWALALAILVVGALLALALRLIVSRGLHALKFDQLNEKTGLIAFLRKGQVAFSPSQLVGIATFWTVFLAASLQVAFILDIKPITTLWVGLETYLPGTVAALLIVVMGWAVVSFLANFSLTLARNASWPQASLLAKGVKTVGLVLVVALAAEQLKLQIAVFSSLFLIVAGGLSFGVALAFGLGCQDLARDAMKRFLAKLKEQDHPRKGPDFEG